MKGDENENYHALLKEAYLEIRRLKAELRDQSDDIAVIGMGCRFPGDCDSPEKLHAFLMDGGDAVGPVPADRGDWSTGLPESVPLRAGFAASIDEFDPLFFGISPREAEAMDPQQRLLLTSAWEALERAGLTRKALQGSRTGVFAGIYNSDFAWSKIRGDDVADAYTAGGMELAFAPNRLSYVLDLKGPSIALNTACSSSLTALHYACNSLRTGECDTALAAGVNLILSPLSMLVASRMLAMAPDGKCKAFDSRADGIVRGEGCGVLVLRRLSHALRDGDPIQAIIAGTAVNEDGRTNVLTAPSGLSQEAVMREALRRANTNPDDVHFVETHGTGTSLGDPIEFGALRDVYGKGAGECVLGAVKTNLGHLEAAAGMAGLFKAILALRSGEIAPNLHLRKLNPEIDERETRLVFAREARGWPTNSPRIAGVSAFGAGGVNAHAVIKAPPAAADREASPLADEHSAAPLVISAMTQPALRRLARSYAEFLRENDHLDDLRLTASLGRDHYEHRLALVGGNAREMSEVLHKYENGEPDPRIFSGHVSGTGRPTAALVFSGQGTEFPGMAARLLKVSTDFRDVFEECDAWIHAAAGWSLRDELARFATDDKETLPTRIAQPLLCALQISLLEYLKSLGITPAAVVGHSLGELTAAHAAGMLDRESTLRLALRRGEIMESAGGAGCMAAFETSERDARHMLRDFPGRLALAAVNGPMDVVIAGESSAMEDLRARAGSGFRRVINRAYAFHGPGMGDAALRFENAPEIEPGPARIPFYSSVTGERARRDEFGMDHLARGIKGTVRFADAMDAMVRDGFRVFVEIGPRPALGQYIKEAGKNLTVLPTLREKTPDAIAVQSLCAGLYCAGIDPDWRKLQTPGSRKIAIPTYAWERQRFALPGAHAPAENTTLREPAEDRAADNTKRSELLRRLRSALPDERADRALDLVRAFMEAILRLPAERVQIDSYLHLQGVGSLAAAELRNQLRAEMGINVPAMRLLSGMTPGELAHIVAREGENGTAAPASSPSRPPTSLPASPLETMLMRLFGESLGLDDYPRDGNYHDLGGDDDGLVRLHATLRDSLPHAPSIEELKNNPSPAKLARRLYARSATQNSRTSFVTRPVARPDADLLLFCFPHGGGNADFYRDWDLDERVELISLQPPGQGERFMEEPITSMAEYLDLVVREFTPLLTKPWATFGHSMGTLIAFEFARRMRAVDAPPPRHMIVSAGPAPNFIEETLGNLNESAIGETIRKGIPAAIMEDRELRDLFVPALLADIAKLGTYVYREEEPLECDLTVLVGENDELVQMKHSRAWRNFTGGTFNLRTLPGGHHYAYTHRRALLSELNSILAKIIWLD